MRTDREMLDEVDSLITIGKSNPAVRQSISWLVNEIWWFINADNLPSSWVVQQDLALINEQEGTSQTKRSHIKTLRG